MLIYGDTILYEGFCDFCEDKFLCGNKNMTCDCGNEIINIQIKEVIQICGSKRKNIAQKIKNKIKLKQHNLCYWCGREFGTPVLKKYKLIKLRMHIDHILPISYLPLNDIDNLVGSCNICNIFKSSKIFKTETECKNYLLEKWNEYIKYEKIIESCKDEENHGTVQS